MNYWYKNGIIYQVHVKAYRDSNSDGIGDFGGLLQKLDYIQNLGVTIIWLLPFYPSPLRDDGYDIADYTQIHPDYGTLEDFNLFLKEAHKRGMKVVTELVLNHTSDQHPWFKKSRNSPPGSQQRDFYVWSDTPEKYKEARIIFQDFETSNWSWDPVAKAYYWHRFYAHQPDLNFDNPLVHKILFKVVDFWFNIGVDGLRLDAVPYLYEREGTNCENLPETHEFLKKLNAHVQSKYKGKMLLAEANQWPEDAVAYFGNGDECQMAFHFPLMPRLFMSIQMEDRFPIVDILEQTPEIPDTCQWAMFLRNHDELTLEMVTDEERDYMYRFYAKEFKARINLGIRRRLAPLVENNRRKIELLNILLFSFPGTPIIYYGDEIGMGDNFYLGDRNGVRTPMQWGFDKNAGFSEANPQRLFLPVIIDPEYHYEAVNVEVQQRNSSSLLWWMKKAISIRKNYKAFGNGSLEFLSPANPKVLSFIRKYNDEVILVVANLSRFAQATELDLLQYEGYLPIEAFSRNKYPVIKNNPYILTLNAYDYYWFILTKKREQAYFNTLDGTPGISFNINFKQTLEKEKRNFEKIISEYLQVCDWLNGPIAQVSEVKISDEIQIPGSSGNDWLIIITVNYIDRAAESYVIPLTIISGEQANTIIKEYPHAVIAKIKLADNDAFIIDGSYDESFRINLLKSTFGKKTLRGPNGFLSININGKWKRNFSNQQLLHPSLLMKSENKNLSFLYDNKLSLKLYRRLEEGKNPGVEIIAVLSEKTNYQNFPPFVGTINYKSKEINSVNFGLISEYVNNQGDAWTFMKDSARRFYDTILSLDPNQRIRYEKLNPFENGLSEFNLSDTENHIDQMTIELVKQLGLCTSEFHREISSIKDDPDFAPEPFSLLYQRSIYQSARSLIRSTFRIIRRSVKDMPENIRNEFVELETYENTFINFMKRILSIRINAMKIRIHGNYHLRQILFTGKDFVITNFEGQTSSAISERRLKRSALRDISSMNWSIYFAASIVLNNYMQIDTAEKKMMQNMFYEWYINIFRVFLKTYTENIKDLKLIPDKRTEFLYMIKFYLVEKMFIELRSGIINNASWIDIPLKALKDFVAVFKNEMIIV